MLRFDHLICTISSFRLCFVLPHHVLVLTVPEIGVLLRRCVRPLREYKYLPSPQQLGAYIPVYSSILERDLQPRVITEMGPIETAV